MNGNRLYKKPFNPNAKTLFANKQQAKVRLGGYK